MMVVSVLRKIDNYQHYWTPTSEAVQDDLYVSNRNISTAEAVTQLKLKDLKQIYLSLALN